MNTHILEGNWTRLIGYARKTWGDLSDSELEKIKGQKDKLIGLIEQKYGHSKEAVEDKINAFLKEIESHNISETIDTALQKKDEIIDYSRHMSEVLEQYIKDKPLTAVTCSLGLGFLLGKLLK